MKLKLIKTKSSNVGTCIARFPNRHTTLTRLEGVFLFFVVVLVWWWFFLCAHCFCALKNEMRKLLYIKTDIQSKEWIITV